MRQIVIATSNAHKVQELQDLLAECGVEAQCIPMHVVCNGLVIDETGSTFEENAYIKARIVHNATGMCVLADDSGLEVDALDGAPGVYSARYAGDGATDASNRRKLVDELRTRDVRDSAARFRCVVCYVDAARTVFGEGTSEGSVSLVERGSAGFGYDPLFTPVNSTRTYAEMTSQEKSMSSHRGVAVRHLAQQLKRIDSAEGNAIRDNGEPLIESLTLASIGAVTNNELLIRAAVQAYMLLTTDVQPMYEALLQSYLFGGFPAGLESLTILQNEWVRTGRNYTPVAAAEVDDTTLHARGVDLCQQVYGHVYPTMVERLTTVSPDLAAWMVEEGYGKTLARPGLSTVYRELCIVAMLAALDRHNQLRSHVRGALRVGATVQQLEDCAALVTEHLDARRGSQILRFVLLQERGLAD